MYLVHPSTCVDSYTARVQISPVWSLFGSDVRPFLLHLMVFPDALKIGHIDRLKDKQVLTLLCDYVRIL